MRTDPTSKVPLSRQVERWITGRIADGELRIGEKIPSEQELAAQLKVSRPTVKRAVSRLVAAGIVECQPCIGSFVKKLPPAGARVRHVACLVPSLADAFFGALARDLEPVLRESGYSMLLALTDGRPALAREQAEVLCRQESVKGILAETAGAAELARRFKKTPCPLVALGIGAGPAAMDRVRTDLEQACRDLVAYLAWLGHRRVAVIGNAAADHAATAPLVAALSEAGIAPDPAWVIESHWPADGAGPDAWRRLWGGRARPTAVVATGDAAAVGLMQAARESGVDVPGQLSVAGMGNLPFGALQPVPLTTVSFEPLAIARQAVRLLAVRIQADHVGPPFEERVIAPKLVVRGSCARPAD